MTTPTPKLTPGMRKWLTDWDAKLSCTGAAIHAALDDLDAEHHRAEQWKAAWFAVGGDLRSDVDLPAELRAELGGSHADLQ